jgi:hypothetical protein
MSERKLTRGLDDIAPNNSDKANRPRTVEPNEDKRPTKRKKLDPIVKGPVVKQKPNFFDKFKTSFLGEGGNIGEFVVYDILVPAFRSTISDMGFGLIEMFFGSGRNQGRGRDYGGYGSRIVRDRGRSYIDYKSSSDRDRGRSSRDDSHRDLERTDRARHNFGNVVFTNRGEAEEVLSRLVDLIEEYDEATVAAFYELSGIESEYTDDRYGWTNLRDAYTDRVRNGYIIVFPQTRPL